MFQNNKMVSYYKLIFTFIIKHPEGIFLAFCESEKTIKTGVTFYIQLIKLEITLLSDLFTID